MIEIIAASLGGVLILALSCYVLGGVLPASFLLPNRSAGWQRLAIGWAILVVVLRIPLREDLPQALALAILVLLALVAVIKDARSIVSRRASCAADTASPHTRAGARLLPLLPMLPLLAMFYLPLLADDAIYYRNFGPDLIGNLVSANYVVEGRHFGDLLAAFAKSIDSFDWWHSTRPDPWRLLDIRDSIAIEFFLRSVRWGHAALTGYVVGLTGQGVWFGFYVVVLFSLLLLPPLLVEEGRRRGLTPGMAILLAVFAVAGSSYVLMYYEGISVQLLVTPFLVFLILTSDEILRAETGIGQRVVFALITSAMMTTFGEGVQLLATFMAVLTGLHLVTAAGQRGRRARELASCLGILIALVVVLSPALTFDFLSWSYVRLKDQFDGGALHFNYSLLSILFQLPYVRLSGGNGASSIHLMLSGGTAVRLLELALLGGVGLVLLLRKGGREFLAAAIVIALVVKTGHRYAMWKTMVIFQPLLLVLFAGMGWQWIGERGKLRVLVSLVVLALLGQTVFMWQYHRHAIRMYPAQFEISKENLNGKSYALLTPSQADTYLYVATVGPLNWLNGGPRQFDLPARFSTEEERNLQVALYFDCQAEGKERCHAIRNAMPALKENTLSGTSMKAADFLREDGLVDPAKLHDAVKAHFGVDAR